LLKAPEAPRIGLLDWMMPGMNGVDVCRAIRRERPEPYAYIRQRKEKLEREIRNFSHAIAEHGHSAYLFQEIATREAEISSITQRLLSGSKDSLETHLDEMRRFVENGIADLRGLLNRDPALAKPERQKHLSEIRRFPPKSAKIVIMLSRELARG
jgi:CheY-like chemotaxis protein